MNYDFIENDTVALEDLEDYWFESPEWEQEYHASLADLESWEWEEVEQTQVALLRGVWSFGRYPRKVCHYGRWGSGAPRPSVGGSLQNSLGFIKVCA